MRRIALVSLALAGSAQAEDRCLPSDQTVFQSDAGVS